MMKVIIAHVKPSQIRRVKAALEQIIDLTRFAVKDWIPIYLHADGSVTIGVEGTSAFPSTVVRYGILPGLHNALLDAGVTGVEIAIYREQWEEPIGCSVPQKPVATKKGWLAWLTSIRLRRASRRQANA